MRFRPMGWAAVCVAGWLGTGSAAEPAQPGKVTPASSPAHVVEQPTAQMKTVLDAFDSLKPKPFHTLSPKAARKGPTARDAVAKVLKQEKQPKPKSTVKTSSATVPGPTGNLPVRIYTPKGNAPFPVVVYFHGGGFVVANKDAYDAGARALAEQALAVVVSVDYREAPEHRFPAALDDATAAFRYVQSHADKFKGDASRVAVAGESAGANLAAAVSLRENTNHGTLPVFQLLVYPFINNDVTSPSHVENGAKGYFVGNLDIAWFWEQYLGADWKSQKNPEALPIYATAEQLKGLEPAFIITADLDPLKDEGQDYAKKLKAAGVAVESKNYPGVTHEFFGMGAVLDEAKQAEADAAGALSKAFSNTAAPSASGGAGTAGAPVPTK